MAAYDATYRPGVLGERDDPTGYLEPIDHYTSHQFPVDESSEMSMEDVIDRSRPESPTMLVKLTDQLAGVSSKVLEGGRQLYLQQRESVQMGEGPSLVRFLCFLGGLGMLISSLLSMVNLFSLFIAPSTYVLQIYQGFFGVITMVVEAKDWDCLDQFKPWMTEWFRFLTVPAGKGAFYVFVGSLGVSLWVRNLLAFTIGLYMSAMGLICVAVHAGSSRKRQLTHQPLRSAAYNDRLDEEGYNVRGLMPPRDTLASVLDQTFPHNGVGTGARHGQYLSNRLDDDDAGDAYVPSSRRDTTTTSAGMGHDNGQRSNSSDKYIDRLKY